MKPSKTAIASAVAASALLALGAVAGPASAADKTNIA